MRRKRVLFKLIGLLFIVLSANSVSCAEEFTGLEKKTLQEGAWQLVESETISLEGRPVHIISTSPYVKYTYDYTYSDDSYEVITTVSDGEISTSSEFEIYDYYGNLLRSHSGFEGSDETYTYNEYGLKTSCEYSGMKFIYEYDSDGNCIKYYDEADPSNVTTYEYDELGRVKESRRYDNVLQREKLTAYSYEDNTTIVSEYFDADSPEWDRQEITRRDDHNQIIYQCELSKNGGKVERNFSYVYDEYGNVIEKSRMDHGKESTVSYYRYEYVDFRDFYEK